MNPSESILYPASYYRDMAFFVTKSITNIFGENSSSAESSDVSAAPPHIRKSETSIISAAIDGHFNSEWESNLYNFIHAIFHKSMLDESVPIGTVVLLDLLGDLHKMGQFKHGKRSTLILPAYPHKKYLCYFIGAFMLAHRLISRKGPHDEMFWEHVLGERVIITLGELPKLESDFRTVLEDNINYYPPPPIPLDDPAYRFLSAGDHLIRTNPLIPRLRYLKTKATMYAHIRVRMTSRGEPLVNFDPSKRRKKGLPMHFPPCHEYMLDKLVFIAKTKEKVPELHDASDKQVLAFLHSKSRKTKPVGLGLIF